MENWQAMPDDARVRNGIWLSLILVVMCWATQTPLALVFGVWAAGKQRFRAVVTAVYFMPLLLSSAAIAVVWGTLMNPHFGVAGDFGAFLRGTLGPLGLLPDDGVVRSAADGNFLGDSTLGFLVVVMVVLWQWMPFHMLLYQAAARSIPQSLYEASEIDGAGRLQQFFRITLPQLRHTIVASSVLIVVGSMTTFEAVLIVTGGGPGDSTRILPLHMYFTAFQGNNMGYGSAMAVLLVILGFLLALVTIWVSGYNKMASQREGAS
jgi:xylobiose transport system permease protein